MFEALKKIGLSENEAKVYLALLELGAATADEIAKKAGVKRPTTYVQLEELGQMGLVTTYEKAARKDGAEKTFFRGEDPEYLKKIVERDSAEVKEQEEVLHKMMPDLQKLFAFAGERPKVRFFEGMEGFKTAQDEFLKTVKVKEIFSIANVDEIFKLFPTHQNNYTPRRVQKNIRSKLLYTSAKGPFLKDSDEGMLRESKFIPQENFPFTCDLVIYDNKVQITALREKPAAIIIEDQDMANSMKAIFDFMWKAVP
ncbi:MAG: hypothetical protein HYT12_04555 [Candidatus Liptonbacteria bacterium]|nr:hypothetical protein [Candidatus Liptonbacteria bacterium]